MSFLSVSFFNRALPALFLALLFQNCMKDECKEMAQSKAYVPVYSSYEQFRTDIQPEGPRKLEDPGKIFNLGNYLLINEPNKGIHIVDNSDPASPRFVSFIPIPGNIDMAVKDGILYADSYTDLIVMDLSSPAQPEMIGRKKDLFPYDPYQYTPYEGKYVRNVDPSKGVVVDWKLKEVEAERACDESPGRPEPFFHSSELDDEFGPDNSATYSYSSGNSMRENTMTKGGSMSRFAVTDSDRLYSVKGDELGTFDITDARSPSKVNERTIDHGIQTLFSDDEELYIGARDGMHIYDISSPSAPSHLSTYEHVEQCDPVVVKGDYAYVTLRSGSDCGGFTDELQVVDVSNPSDPREEKSYELEDPHGLDIQDSELYVCDGDGGLVSFDASNTPQLDEEQSFGDIHGYDAIALSQTLIVVGDDGIHQYDPEEELQKLSEIPVHGN